MISGRKLLLADDSVTIQKVVDLTFTDLGVEVVTVGDGQQALDRLEEVAPDIVLADVYMPGLSGYKVCEHIKRTERFRHIPVMLLVGSFEPFDEAEARRVGADDHLTKPFQSIRTLISKVGNLLSGGGGSQDSAEAPTQRLAPPPEAEKENRPDTDFLERTTADTAPLPDAAEEAEQPAHGAPQREVPFSDLSMDDEMIEATSPAGEADTAEQAVYARRTEQYSVEDLREAGILQPAESSAAEGRWEEAAPETAREEEAEESPAAAVEHAPETFAAAGAGETAGQWGQPRASASAGRLQSSDDALLDLDDPGEPPPPAMAEADDFILDLLDDEPAPAPAAAAQDYPPIFEEGTARPAADSFQPAGEAEAPEAPHAAQEFVESEVMGEEGSASEFGPAVSRDESPAESSEQTPSYEFSMAPTVRLPEDYRPEDYYPAGQAVAATEQPVPAAEEEGRAASAPAGQITLDQLSPEAIDAIARRAVELLSERVVEQVAWEVVPDLAERLIKRRIEEGKNSSQ